MEDFELHRRFDVIVGLFSAGVEHFTERHDLTLFTHDEYLEAFGRAEMGGVCDSEA
ncbi:MAG TPA: hypothetical protein VGJ87_17130 [Roseiflexaceae bacterium]|jgi:hypothetical protein